MSKAALEWAWRQRLESAGLKLVALALADAADGAGSSRIPVRDLATRTDLSPRRVQAHLGILVERGLLERQGRRAPNGGSGPNAYRLRLGPPSGDGAC